MPTLHSNNTGASTKVPSLEKPDNTREFTDGLNDALDTPSPRNATSTRVPDLQMGPINYLGSSYSGADIKVFVNIYNDKTDVNNIISELEKNRLRAVAISDACKSLVSHVYNIVFEVLAVGAAIDRWPNFLKAIGLYAGNSNDDARVEAISYMRQHFFRPMLAGGLTENNVNTTRTNADRTIAFMDNQAAELGDEIKVLKDNTENGIIQGGLFFLGTLQTISVQSHREKFGVRSLGRSYVKAYTRGPRTTAGSMIFTVFHEHAFAGLMRRMSRVESDEELSSLLPDQMPPLDFTVIFANEYGSQSEFRLYGVEILNDGVTYSIEDLLSENVMQFVCRDVDPLTSRGRVGIDRSARNIESRVSRDIAASNLFNQNDNYNQYLDRLKVRRRLVNR